MCTHCIPPLFVASTSFRAFVYAVQVYIKHMGLWSASGKSGLNRICRSSDGSQAPRTGRDTKHAPARRGGRSTSCGKSSSASRQNATSRLRGKGRHRFGSPKRWRGSDQIIRALMGDNLRIPNRGDSLAGYRILIGEGVCFRCAAPCA